MLILFYFLEFVNNSSWLCQQHTNCAIVPHCFTSWPEFSDCAACCRKLLILVQVDRYIIHESLMIARNWEETFNITWYIINNFICLISWHLPSNFDTNDNFPTRLCDKRNDFNAAIINFSYLNGVSVFWFVLEILILFLAKFHYFLWFYAQFLINWETFWVYEINKVIY